MNNYSIMAISLDKKHQQQAFLLTLGFLIIAIAMMFLLKWKLPDFETPLAQAPLEVEISLEDVPPAPAFGGGGGGGNTVHAAGDPGVAPYAPAAPGSGKNNAPVEDNPIASAPEINRSAPANTKNNIGTSDTKTEPKTVLNPAPQQPKAALDGKSTTGTASGGNNAADSYERTGGTGNGSGVGTGSGTGGGSGTGTGGGTGSGTGAGSGASKVSGSRTLQTNKPMNAGENISGRIRAQISVAPDGTGTFVRATGGSLMNNAQAVSIVKEWLRNNRFNRANDTTVEVYDFNIRIGG